MEKDTQMEAQALERHINDHLAKHGTKNGAMVYACGKVYGKTVESRKAVQRGNKTLSRYRAFLAKNGGQKPTI
jgi:hypothetical protein